MTEKSPAAGARTVPVKPPAWKSRSLILMVVVTLVGVGLWAYAAATKPAATARTQQAGAPGGVVSGFSSGDPLSGASGATTPAPERRFIDTASPAVARFGGCFVAGFCVAYAFKKFIKVTAIIVGVLLIAIFFMKKSGIIDLDWASLESSINSSVAWLKGEAGAMKEFITGYLPSTGSAMAGMFVGFRKG
jgi:uncharacterized membrane protein (Fun14 family)